MSAYTLTPLGPGIALDINDKGEVCGKADDGGWLWSNGIRTLIKAFTPEGLFFRAHTATEVREDGTVLGDIMFLPMDNSSFKRFIWHGDKYAIVGDGEAPLSTRRSANGQMVDVKSGRASLFENGITSDLNYKVQAPGWLLTTANAINSHGAIVGGGSLNGDQYAYLLNPISNRISAVESYAGFVLPSEHIGHIVRIMAQDTEWNGEWRKLGQVLVENPPQLWVDMSAPRRRGREYKVEARS